MASFPLAIEWNKPTPKTTHGYGAVIKHLATYNIMRFHAHTADHFVVGLSTVLTQCPSAVANTHIFPTCMCKK